MVVCRVPGVRATGAVSDGAREARVLEFQHSGMIGKGE